MELEGRAPEFFRVLTVMISLAIISTALRVYVRVRIVKNFGKDDYLMVIALLVFILFTVCAYGGLRYGTGRHDADLTPASQEKALRYWWLCYPAYTCTMTLTKLSIGFFLLRVTIERAHRRIIYAAMGLTAATATVYFFVTVLQCRPVAFFWTRAVDFGGGGDGNGSEGEGGRCLDMRIIAGLTYFYSGVSALCDLTLGLLPVAMLWSLAMSRGTKMAVAPILGMGCIASAAVLVRMAYVRDFTRPDFLYNTTDIAIWSTIEQGLAITAGSLACLRPLFRIVARKLSSYGSGFSGGEEENSDDLDQPQNPVWPGRSVGSKRGRGKGAHGPWGLLDATRNTATGRPDFEMAHKKPAAVVVDDLERQSVDGGVSDVVSSRRILV